MALISKKIPPFCITKQILKHIKRTLSYTCDVLGDKSPSFDHRTVSRYPTSRLSSFFPKCEIGYWRFMMQNSRNIFCFGVPVVETTQNARFYSKMQKNRGKEDNVLIRSMASIIQKTDKWDSLLKELCAVSASEITPPVAVQVLKRIKKPDLAFKFFDWLEHLKGFNHDGLTYTAILKVLTRDCNPSHASIADSLLRKKIRLGLDVTPADYDYVLHQWARVGRSDMGLPLLNEMIACGFTPAITSCSILLEELFGSKQEELGWDLFYRMLNGSIDALETETFNVAMKFLCVKGNLEEALDLFAIMRAEDYVPDLDSYNILIKGCCEKGEVKMVFNLFKHMLDIKVKPDSYTMNLLIKELCKQGRPEYGNDLFNHMRRVGWLDRKFVYTQLVESLTNYGWWMKALKIFVKMVRRGHHPKLGLYNNLIRRLCMGDRLREAHKLKDLMLVKGYLQGIEVYNGLIDGLCLIGRMEMVEKLLVELCNKGLSLNFETHNLILRGFCMMGDVKASLEWVEKMMEEGWEPNDGSYKSIITCLSSKGRVVEEFQVKDHNSCRLLIDELKKLKDMN